MKPTLPALVFLLVGSPLDAAAPPAVVDYQRDVKPVLKERCFACHGSLQQKGGLRLDTASLIRQGGDSGSVVGEDGILLDRLTTRVPSRRMPRDGEPLTDKQIDAIRAWVNQGMKAPANERPEPDPLAHWSFRKPVRPSVPAGDGANPIDRFLSAQWKAKQLRPAPPADRATLVRRVYLDLTGLPPTRQELHDALAMPYEKLVDRLLASPHYGERWARHWMDVWRYSDWYGRRSVPDVLNSYGMIWRWRDWIVRSLNEGRPYDRMVQEMLAADELCPTERENVVATGFLVRNFFRWNYNNWMRDNVEHTAKAFLGLTMQCAQCHDHKYDPITQVDYFRFRAFFEPLEIRHDRVPGEPDPGVYPKYSYGAAYKPITSGLVRVFDEKLDARTWMYSKGDERDRVPGKPPVKPGAPAAFGGDRLTITPVALPPEAHTPGLLAFVQDEEEKAKRGQVEAKRLQLRTARQQRELVEKQLTDADALTKVQAKLRLARAAEVIRTAELAAIEAEWLSARARIAADRAKQGKAAGDREALAKAAAKAEKVAAWLAALAKLAQQEQNLLIYTADGPPAEAAKTEKLVTTLRTAADTSRAAIAKAGNTYTPLGPTYPTKSTGRRLALAKWITSRDNPLTARVAVNHIWSWHLGRPLVESTANFGRQGAAPSHPELLDWLACELMDNGWRMKPLHRLIVTSQAYRMASSHPDDAANHERDPDNKMLWRFPPRRLEAEAVRDALLHCAGELDGKLGGREIAQDQGLTVPRRSLYFAHHGETRMVFLDLFDAANPTDCYRRSASVRPQQALAMANSELTLRMARKLAAKLETSSSPLNTKTGAEGENVVPPLRGGDAERASRRDATTLPLDDAAFVRAAFEQVLARQPTAAELAASAGFLARQAELFRTMKLTPTPDGPSADPTRRARENLVAALFNHTDFVTLR